MKSKHPIILLSTIVRILHNLQEVGCATSSHWVSIARILVSSFFFFLFIIALAEMDTYIFSAL
jgi:hypothetical protein